MSPPPPTERDLLALAMALGARSVAGWSMVEASLCEDLPSVAPTTVSEVSALIEAGEDPLGDLFCALRSPEERRPQGATYTPRRIVDAMLGWARSAPTPGRVVDPGVGSGRFMVAAGRVFPDASLLGVDLDPVAAIVARGHLAAAGFAARADVRVADYRDLALPETRARTLFVGNPPYVRHHLIDPVWKAWLTREAARLGLGASQLAGLHVYFYLATATYGRKGDIGCLLTAAEWLDVNYGSLVRDLFLGPLGGSSLTVIEPTAEPFPDAASTAAISCFKIGARPAHIRVQRVADLAELGTLQGDATLRRERLEAASRWTPLTRAMRRGPEGYVELGELCRVHRGQVTGSNRVWIAGAHSVGLPEGVLFGTVTKARELFAAGSTLTTGEKLRRVIDIPADLDQLDTADRRVIEAFLEVARRLGADAGYVAQNRRAWWAVGLRAPAPILATYMARRPPAFVRNLAEARHINIAHGLYPRESFSPAFLDALAAYLSRGVMLSEGRTYSGGLTKFEPREMERLLVPGPQLLQRESTT